MELDEQFLKAYTLSTSLEAKVNIMHGDFKNLNDVLKGFKLNQRDVSVYNEVLYGGSGDLTGPGKQPIVEFQEGIRAGFDNAEEFMDLILRPGVLMSYLLHLYKNSINPTKSSVLEAIRNSLVGIKTTIEEEGIPYLVGETVTGFGILGAAGGIYTIKYKKPRQDSQGNWLRSEDGKLEFKSGTKTKTVYDPEVYPPENIEAGLQEAIKDYDIEFNPKTGEIYKSDFKITAYIEDKEEI